MDLLPEHTQKLTTQTNSNQILGFNRDKIWRAILKVALFSFKIITYILTILILQI